MMTESAQKASETRKKNEAKRREMFLRKEADKVAIRSGLMEIISNAEATAAEKLEAARIILEIGL